ncbi:hypothetical protein IJT17_10490 [bacterium]|nr:hypothetical protein [bacterium]
MFGCYWLAQETYEAYKAMCTSYNLRYKITNPFSLINLDKPDYCFFPWPDRIVSIGIWMIFLAIILMWVYKRINVSSVYAFMSLGFAGLGGSLLLGFQTAYPRPEFVFSAFLSLTLIIASLSGFLTVMAVDKLPYFGFPDKYLLHEQTGYPLRYLPYAIGGIILLLMWLLSFSAGKFFSAECLHNKSVIYMVFGLLVLFSGVFGYAMVPFVTLYDRPLLGGGYAKIIEPMLKITGPAKRYEIIYSVIALCALYAITAVFVKGTITGDDFIGILCMGGVGLGIIHAELHRSSAHVDVKVKKKSGVWN